MPKVSATADAGMHPVPADSSSSVVPACVARREYTNATMLEDAITYEMQVQEDWSHNDLQRFLASSGRQVGRRRVELKHE